MKFNKNHMGFATGIFFGGVHFLWAIAVKMGIGDYILQQLHEMYFVSRTMTVLPFSLKTSIIGIFSSVIVGYATGYLFAALWNTLTKKQ